MKDNATINRFIGLRASGYSYAKIASELKVSKSILIAWSKTHQHEIANLKEIERESLLEKLNVAKKHRIEMLSLMLEKVKANLPILDFTAIPPEKFVEMTLKLLDAINKEKNDPEFTQVSSIFSGDAIADTLFMEKTEKWIG